MVASVLNASFGPMLTTTTWVVVPLYAAFLGLVLSSSARPSTRPGYAGAADLEACPPQAATQFVLVGVGALLVSSYRGYEGTLAQGQLALTIPGIRLSTLVVGLGAVGAAVLAPSTIQGPSRRATLGVNPLALAPLLTVLWSLLPLVTHVTTALLVLELVGVTLVWAVSNSSTPGVGAQQAGLSGPVYGIVFFVWASGLSALALLLCLGLNGLGSGLGGGLPLALGSGLAGPENALLALVLSLKFLVGGGQFLLMAWYRYLPPESLAVYLVFYYPAHLTVGLSVLVGLSLAFLQASLSLILLGLGLALLALVPHVGAQTSPAATLAGSSFVGLALIVVATLL